MYIEKLLSVFKIWYIDTIFVLICLLYVAVNIHVMVCYCHWVLLSYKYVMYDPMIGLRFRAVVDFGVCTFVALYCGYSKPVLSFGESAVHCV